MLTSTMKQFATHADLDNTLEHITIKLDVSSDYECPPADTLWTETDEQIRLEYAPSAAGLEYALDDGETATDTLMACAEGWSRIRVVQSEPTDSWTPTEDLSDLMLNNLFSRDAFVRVSDQPIGDLSIDKTVAGYEGMGPALQQTLYAKEFTYEVKLTDADGAPLAGSTTSWTARASRLRAPTASRFPRSRVARTPSRSSMARRPWCGTFRWVRATP